VVLNFYVSPKKLLGPRDAKTLGPRGVKDLNSVLFMGLDKETGHIYAKHNVNILMDVDTIIIK
jgi:hypothetical protein